METLILYSTNFFELLNAMAIYILVGIIFAGVLKQIIPDDFVSKHLGEGNFSSVLKASLLGIPMPLCSCSVIPFANSLKKEGASKGAVQSFLISTPITGADSIIATYAFFGWVFTIYRVVSSLIIAIIAGVLQNMVDNKFKKEKGQTKVESSCCCESSCSSVNKDNETIKKSFSIKEVFDYAFNTIFKDFAKPLLFGLLLGAVFTTFLPKEYANMVFENQFLSYGLILLISIPLYVCATASLPIAAALMLSGLSGGAAFIFLSAGPATNSVTMSVIYKSLGKSALVIYLGTIAILSLVFGYLFDTYFPTLDILNFVNHKEETSILNIISSVFMLCLMAYYFIKPILEKK
ncbi:SO_0444 family Cu/Zn efflux transporter [Arcobacteraceae bacterium]|nr:SO_0444 family Cu/Zn efflux transporter [Arcobacteraceae bacterium]